MREYTTDGLVTVADDATLTDAMFDAAERLPDMVLFRRKLGEGFAPVTAREFADLVVRVAGGLVARGVSPGDRVGIMSRTRYEWSVVDYAIWTAGAVTVPVYETSSPDQVGWILSDSGIQLLVVEDDALAKKAELARPQAPALGEVLVIDGGAIDTLVAAGADVTADDLAARRANVVAASIATLIYTSGTTGRPKGCELSHRAMIFDAVASGAAVPEVVHSEAVALLFLPLAHVLARSLAVGAVQTPFEMAFVSDASTLLADLPKVRPTFLLAVPRVFEKVHAGSKRKAHAEGKGKIFDAAEATAIAYSQALDSGGPGLVLKLRHALFDKLVYAKIRAALGGQCTHAVSGGAPLGERLGHFFRGVGLTVLEGYGLTETSSAASANPSAAARIGTVGRPLPGTTVRVADDGEVLFKGPMVFSGYWNNETATKEVLDSDGFLHTGDVGEIDDDGYLKITGRKKEILVTAGGKNVAPAPLENLVKAHPLVSQVVVVGDREPFIAALVTIDLDALPAWNTANGKPAEASVADLKDDPDLRAAIQTAIDEANRSVSKAESIRQFSILPEDFTVENGDLTPSMKVKRGVVMDRYADVLDGIYASR